MTDTDRGHRAPTSRASLITLVVLLVVALLTLLSPLGWDFLMPRFVEMVTVTWNSLVHLGTWIFDSVIAPVVAWLV